MNLVFIIVLIQILYVFPQLSLEDLKANYEKEKEKLESMAPEEQSVLEG